MASCIPRNCQTLKKVILAYPEYPRKNDKAAQLAVTT